MKNNRILFAALLLCSLLWMTACAAPGTGAPPSTEPTVAWSDLQLDQHMALRYAKNFSVDADQRGYALIRIIDDGRYLVVPENQPVPAGLDADITVLQQPLDHIYLVATSAMDLFCSLDALDAVTLSGTNADGWYIEAAKEAMQAGTITYAGKYSAPDYEKILAQGCDLSVQSTMIYHTPEVKEKLEQFHIPVLVDKSSYEEHPLGRAEWIKLYGVLLNKQALAQTLMDAQTAQLNAVMSEAASDQSVAFFYIGSSGSVNVRKGNDYVAKMIELAGGQYIFDTLARDSLRSTVNLQMEEFYASAKDADLLIYNSAIDGELKTLDALLAKSPLLKNFKAVKAGNVWCTTKNMFQETMSLGTMIVDFHTVIAAGEQPATYLYRLQ